MGIKRVGIAGRAALYCAAIATVIGIAATVVAALAPVLPNPTGLGRARTAYYQADPRRFDMLFLGDSRTYCGIHSDLIDPLTGRRSINLSAFSHWLPAQYAQLRDIADDIAPGTVVVLSIGHQNFDPSPIQRSYPISLANAARLVAFGISPPQLVHNLVWALPPVRTLLDRSSLRDRLLARAGLRVNSPPPAAIPGQANFDLPYAAVSITDFWRRWHLTLSTWLRDYVYFPLGGSRMATRWGTSRNLLLTMLIAGFWHGAGWGFLLWGLLHGLLLAGERFLGADKDASRQRAAPTLASLPRRIAVFHLIAILWVFFRAETLDTAFAILSQCFAWNMADGALRPFAAVAILVAATLAIQLAAVWKPIGERIGEVPVVARAAIYGVAAFVIVMFNSAAPPAFIYFRF
jgi:hypothetical protein